MANRIWEPIEPGDLTGLGDIAQAPLGFIRAVGETPLGSRYAVALLVQTRAGAGTVVLLDDSDLAAIGRVARPDGAAVAATEAADA